MALATSSYTGTTRLRRLRGRIFHLWFLLRRPMTLGVRAVVHDRESDAVFLVRHTYIAGWHLPGGGVEAGETMLEALLRELDEEANIEPLEVPRLLSLHFNRRASRRDHVAVYLVSRFENRGPRRPDREIAEAGFFPVGALPVGVTESTRIRIAEALGAAQPSHFW
jgi:ADP-ribose pyrophosphatase YjhB (NUDIX family)